MRKACSIGCICFLLVTCRQQTIAQAGDTILNKQTSIDTIKNMICEQLLDELHKTASYKMISQKQLAGLLRSPTSIDSISNMVFEKLQQARIDSVYVAKDIVGETISTTKQNLQQRLYGMLQGQEIQTQLHQLLSSLKQPLIKLQPGAIEITGQRLPDVYSAEPIVVSMVSLKSGVSFSGIPVGIQFLRQDFSGNAGRVRNDFSVQFNQEAYLQSLRDRIQLQANQGALLQQFDNIWKRNKQLMIDRLHASLDSITSLYKLALPASLGNISALPSLLEMDAPSLRERLLAKGGIDVMEAGESKLAQLRSLNKDSLTGKIPPDSSRSAFEAVKGIDAIMNKIQGFKNEWQENNSVAQLQHALQDPTQLKAIASSQLDLSGLQKFFLNISNLQLGKSNVSLSPLSISHYINNGVSASMSNKKSFLFLMLGKQTNVNGVYDDRFLASSLPGNTAMGFRAGRGDLRGAFTHISLFSYRQGKSNTGQDYVTGIPGNTIVITFSNRFKISEPGLLSFELSTSRQSYTNQKYSDTLAMGNELARGVQAGNFLRQMAMNLQWEATLKDKGLEYRVYANAIGKAYNNPGSLFLLPGMTELGGNIKKGLLKERLQFSLSGNYRSYSYCADNNKWCNYRFSFLAKWKFKKGQAVSLRYQPYQSVRWQAGQKIVAGDGNRLSLDLNLRRRFGSMQYQHAVTLAADRHHYTADSTHAGNMVLQLSSMQTMLINGKSYYLNLQYSRANANTLLVAFNTQLNIEAGLAYRLGKNMMVNTAVSYNDVQGWGRQAGIRQGISGQLSANCMLSCYADLSANLAVYSPNRMDNVRMNWIVQYYIR